MKLPDEVLPKWETKSRERHYILPLKQKKKEEEKEEEEKKGTGPNCGLLKANKQADQSAHPERTAQSGAVPRRHTDQGDPTFSVHKNFLDFWRSDSLE